MCTIASPASSNTQSQSGRPSTRGAVKPASRQALMTRSAIALTCVLARPEAINIRSASVVLPESSIETISSALASSRPPTRICERMSQAAASTRWFPALSAASEWGVSVSFAFLSAWVPIRLLVEEDEAGGLAFQAEKGFRSSARFFRHYRRSRYGRALRRLRQGERLNR